MKPEDEITVTNLLDEASHDFGLGPSDRVSLYQFEAFTPEQNEQRRVIIEELEAEKRLYHARCEPLIRKLGEIQGNMHVVVNTAPR